MATLVTRESSSRSVFAYSFSLRRTIRNTLKTRKTSRMGNAIMEAASVPPRTMITPSEFHRSPGLSVLRTAATAIRPNAANMPKTVE